MTWFSDLRSRDRWALAAAACVLATLPVIAIGGALDVYAFKWWGVVTAYLGISWLAPGVFLGVAVAQSRKERGAKRPNARGIFVGASASLGLVVLVSAVLAAFWGDELNETAVERKPAVSGRHGRISLVTQATLAKRTRYGPAIWIMCETSDEGRCAVTYDAPACQLWVVENVDGVDRARPLDVPSEGGEGTYDDASDSIGCHWDVP